MKRYIISSLLSCFILVSCARVDLPISDESAIQTAAAATIRARVLQGTATRVPTIAPSLTPESFQNLPISPDDFARFVADVNIPDYSTIEAGTSFTKTWRLLNSTPMTWTAGYKLIFESGDQMGAPTSLPLNIVVYPDDVVDVSIPFTAPTTPGEYRSNWMFQNAKGEKFGVGPKGDLPIYLIIIVVDSNGGTSSGLTGGASIINATVSIDNPNYSGSCPTTLTLSGNISASDAGQALWSLDFGSSTPNFSFDPSGSYALSFETGGGTQYWQYTLTISNSVNATATLKVNGANIVSSNVQGFNVNCQ